MKSWACLPLFAALAWGGAARAEGPVVEVTPIGRHADALLIYDLALEQGWSAQLLRLYRHGGGWEFTVEVEGFADIAEAVVAANLLGEVWGRGVAILGEARPVQVEETRGELSARAPLPTASQVRHRLSISLGGPHRGLERLEQASTLEFQFTRDLPQEGLVMRHRLERRPDQIRLVLEPLAGEGVASVTSLEREGETWVARLEDPGGERGLEEAAALEIIGSFEPQRVLGLPLALPQMLITDPVMSGMRVEAAVEREGQSCLLLQARGPEGAVKLVVSSGEWRLVEVAFLGDTGLVEHRFSDWREIGRDISLPFAMEMRRNGALLESVEVESLRLGSLLVEPDASPSQPVF